MSTLDELLPANASARRTLADMIFEKLEGVEEDAAAGDDSVAATTKKTGKRVHMADGGLSLIIPASDKND